MLSPTRLDQILRAGLDLSPCDYNAPIVRNEPLGPRWARKRATSIRLDFDKWASPASWRVNLQGSSGFKTPSLPSSPVKSDVAPVCDSTTSDCKTRTNATVNQLVPAFSTGVVESASVPSSSEVIEDG